MPHISDAKSTSHSKNAQPHDHIYLESTFFYIIYFIFLYIIHMNKFWTTLVIALNSYLYSE